MFERTPNWWKSAVIYQIYPRSFNDSNGDGIGDIRGIINQLDYLASLGVDALWLSPIYDSPQDDFGYDVSNYQDIYPPYGSLADVDELIASAHEKGLGVIMDVVVNHTSDEHAWFQESRDKNSDKADWYIWRPAKEGKIPGTPGAEPFNHGSIFSGSAWQFDPKRGEYYLHCFSRKQPDLNWENPQVRSAVYKMMRWWLDRGIDGFRLDVINMISKPELRDGVPEPGHKYAYDVTPTNGPRIHEFLHEMNREVFAGRNLLTVGEMSLCSPEMARLYTDPAREELNMAFTFEHVEMDVKSGGVKWDFVPLHLPDLKAIFSHRQKTWAIAGWEGLFFNNHDLPRIVSRWGDDSEEFRIASAKALATVLHMHRGTPFVYQGEELGMTNAGFTSIEQYKDIESLNAYKEAVAMGADPEQMLTALAARSRDNARTPMQWNDSPNGGFSSGKPWLEVNRNYREINASDQVADPESVFSFYRKLIDLRHNNEIVGLGDCELLLPEDESIYALTRTLNDQKWLVVANLTSKPQPVPDELPDTSDGRMILDTHESTDHKILAPWEARIIELNS